MHTFWYWIHSRSFKALNLTRFGVQMPWINSLCGYCDPRTGTMVEVFLPPYSIWLDVIFLSAQVAITATNVSQLQLFEDGQPACVVLALHPPDDQTQGSELSTLLCEMFQPQTQTDALCSDVTFQWLAYTCTGSGGFWMTSCERQANPEVVWCR